MDNSKVTSQPEGSGLKLDFSGLLGAEQVFDAAGDADKQAALIDANCNKVGAEGCGPA